MTSFMDVIFDAFAAQGAIALGGAFLWGVLSVILSPCGIVMIPLVVGYIENTDTPGYWAAIRTSVAFSVGVFVNLMLVGAVFTGIGSAFSGHEVILNWIVAVIYVAMGLHLMGFVRIPWMSFRTPDPEGKRGMWGALALGSLSGLALGPCNFAYTTPVLTFAAKAAATSWIFAAGLVVCYALGHCTVLVASGTFAKGMGRFLNWEGADKGIKVLNFLCGAALMAAAGYLIYNTRYY